MESQKGSGNVPRWENMNRDILSNIFKKLDVVDVIMGASRVCITWFLAAHNKTIWNTIKLNDLDSIVLNIPCGSGTHMQYDVTEKHQYQLTMILTEISKFSRTVPMNLFFDQYSYINEEDLRIVSERMPNIRKLALVMGEDVKLNPFQSAVSKWKYLQTLIVATYLPQGDASSLKLQAIGDNCRNLTNVRFLNALDKDLASNIICYLPILEKISFQTSFVSREAAISLVIGHPKLKILNLSHCVYTLMYVIVDNMYHVISDMEPNEELVKTGTEKLDKFIVCCPDCPICQEIWKHNVDGPQRYTPASRNFWKKQWKSDEIEEFEF